MSLRLLSLEDVKQNIHMSEAIDAMENAFLQLARGQMKLPLRTALPVENENALTLTMPAFLEKDKTLGLKIVSIFPHNTTKNKPSITGVIMLLDASTGEPKVLMDAGYLTAMRTGAVSGLATKYFAIEEAEHVAIIGSGVQAYTQLEAVAAVRNIKYVSVWSRDNTKAKAFAKRLENSYEIKSFESIEDTIKKADIICTATSSTEPLIHFKNLQQHVHINAIGSHTSAMKEIDSKVLQQGMVLVDQLEAALTEAGEIISAIQQGQLNQGAIHEIGKWLLDKKVNYKNQLTIFKSVGLAIQDVSIAEIVYQNAIKKNQGKTFEIH